jgi:hypothetical protein
MGHPAAVMMRRPSASWIIFSPDKELNGFAPAGVRFVGISRRPGCFDHKALSVG